MVTSTKTPSPHKPKEEYMSVLQLIKKLKEFPADYDVQISPLFEDRIVKAELTSGHMTNYVTLYTLAHDRLRQA